MNKSESKYFNTAIRMDEALMSLLEKKDFEYITVKEICKAAEVNRSTFYLHYENTYDLLEESIAYMQNRFLSYFDVDAESFIGKINQCSKNDLMLITPKYLEPYLNYIRDHRKIYAAAMQRPSTFHAQEAYQGLFRHVFVPILNRFCVPSNEHSYMMSFYLGGISAVISEWLREDCSESLEKIMQIIQSCILPQYKNDDAQ